eukprot:COSAG02_NODE_5845_length_3992_cov_2.749037_1_plen_355_part_00
MFGAGCCGQNLEALQVLAETQQTRALNIMRRTRPDATLEDLALVAVPRGSRMPSGKALHATKTDLRPPSFGEGAAPGSRSSSGLSSRMDSSSEALGPYEPPAMRMWRNAPQHWMEYPFLPARVQMLFDQIQAKMDLLPNVDWQPGGSTPSLSPAVTRGGGVGSMAPDSTMGQVDTGVGSFMVPAQDRGASAGGMGMRQSGMGVPGPQSSGGDSFRLQEELGALKRSLDASLMVRKEHDDAVGRFRYEANDLLQSSRKELDDFFAHASSAAAPSSAAPAIGGVGAGGGGMGGDDSAALQHERERNADLQAQVDALKEENLRQQDMLRRHQERWQRVRDEYARKKSTQVGTGPPGQ